LSEKLIDFLEEVCQRFASTNRELQLLAFQTAAGCSFPNFCYYPL